MASREEAAEPIQRPASGVSSTLFTGLACAACIVIFAGLSCQKEFSWEAASRWGYLPASEIWYGKHWGLISSAFVHREIWHAVFNLYWLWVLGSTLELSIGPIQWLAFFLTSAFITSAIQLGMTGDMGFGASGVLYAFFGFMYTARDRYPQFASVVDRKTAITMFVWLLLCIVATAIGIWQVGNVAHVSGLLFGYLVAHAFVLQAGRAQARWGLATVSAVATLFLVWCPWSVTWASVKAHKLLLEGKHAEAIRWSQHVLERGGDPVWALYNLGWAYWESGSQEEYRATLERLRRVSEQDAAELEEAIKAEDVQRQSNANDAK